MKKFIDQKNIDISIVIVNWNVKDLLADCIRSIFNTVKYHTFEIWIVDNNSTDDSVAYIRKLFPELSVIENKNNYGFAYANNQAIKISSGRYVLLLNPDTFLYPEALDRLIDHMDCNPDIGAAGGPLFSPNPELIGGTRHFPNLLTEFFEFTKLNALFPKSKIFGYYRMTYWDHSDTRDVDLLAGAFMLVKRIVIEEVGLLDENIFMYAEDTDWCYRIKKNGWRIRFFSDVKVFHYGEKSSQQVEDLMQLESLWSKYYFFRKHRGVPYAECYRFILLGILLYWIALWSLIAVFTITNKRNIYRKICLKRFNFFKNLLVRDKHLIRLKL